MTKPSVGQPCATCQHPLGEHYRTFDNRNGGCIHGKYSQDRDGACLCRQFTTAYIPTVQLAAPEDLPNCLEDMGR